VLDSAKDGEETGDAPVAEPVAPPASDAEAQTSAPPPAEEVEATIEGEGERIEALPAAEPPAEARRVRENDNRFVINIGININIYTPYKDRDRMWRDNDEVYYDRLSGDRYRQTVIRPDGTRIITVWDRDGEIIRRVKVQPDGTRIILVYYPEDDRRRDWRDPGDDLPPFYLNIPVNEYVLYSEREDEGRIADFFIQPPLEVAARVYSVEEVKRSARLRDTIRRVEIGDLTFDTGSAQIARDQVGSLSKVAAAMQQILDRNPGEVFLIEGHTDAVGSDESNLILSDDRAETVANVLTEFYGIPPENLTTQGYGERYLKVQTENAERANRRATIRRITTLVSPSAS
jgi:outer membrane protein OmpA-like peptidoglycan-associated protein